MKKKLVKGLVICGMIGIGFTALGTNAEAATYYGNGVYCNKQKCWVNWGQDRKSTRLNSSHQPQSRMPSSA